MNSKRALAVLAASLAIGATVYWLVTTGSIAFDAALWREGEKASFGADDTRARMADGLLESHILIGKSRSDVVAMLGPPTTTGYFREFDLVYWLGAERGFIRIDSEWLVLRLDKSGTVSEARIVRD